jgi:hypothetical protein
MKWLRPSTGLARHDTERNRPRQYRAPRNTQ